MDQGDVSKIVKLVTNFKDRQVQLDASHTLHLSSLLFSPAMKNCSLSCEIKKNGRLESRFLLTREYARHLASILESASDCPRSVTIRSMADQDVCVEFEVASVEVEKGIYLQARFLTDSTGQWIKISHPDSDLQGEKAIFFPIHSISKVTAVLCEWLEIDTSPSDLHPALVDCRKIYDESPHEGVSWSTVRTEGISCVEHKLSFIDICLKASHTLYRTTNILPGYLYMGAEAAALMRALPGFASSGDIVFNKVLPKLSYIGKGYGHWQVFITNMLEPKEFLVSDGETGVAGLIVGDLPSQL